ncbi:MAG TPA: SCE4755 family polysaccharide monooxygenase-like protein [Polyangiales bacterium]|nr:SCE4755 family polysaccharide monooxygenase-like protein [Polyangiales bacterium]
MTNILPALLLMWAALWPLEARAHLDLTLPVSRYGENALKIGPCGIAGGERTSNVSYYEPGETIEVRWDEYIDHPGHYRVAFDPDGDDDFVDPATMMELYSNDAVLLDGIVDKGPGERDYVATVTLPDITCDNCTLQVTQVMYDKEPYTVPGDDIYYQCADLVLRVGGAPDAGIDPGIDTDAGANADAAAGCHAGARDVTSLGMLPILLLLAVRRLADRSRLHV